MFDLGWSELLLIAVVAIIVVGPRDLPRLMRTVGQYVTKMRRMARDLQSQFNDALKEAELDDVGKEITDLSRMNPARQIRDSITKPLKSAADDLKRTASDVESAGKEKPAEDEAGPAIEGPQSARTAPADTNGGATGETTAAKENATPEPVASEPVAEQQEPADAEPKRAATGP